MVLNRDTCPPVPFLEVADPPVPPCPVTVWVMLPPADTALRSASPTSTRPPSPGRNPVLVRTVPPLPPVRLMLEVMLPPGPAERSTGSASGEAPRATLGKSPGSATLIPWSGTVYPKQFPPATEKPAEIEEFCPLASIREERSTPREGSGPPIIESGRPTPFPPREVALMDMLALLAGVEISKSSSDPMEWLGSFERLMGTPDPSPFDPLAPAVDEMFTCWVVVAVLPCMVRLVIAFPPVFARPAVPPVCPRVSMCPEPALLEAPPLIFNAAFWVVVDGPAVKVALALASPASPPRAPPPARFAPVAPCPPLPPRSVIERTWVAASREISAVPTADPPLPPAPPAPPVPCGLLPPGPPVPPGPELMVRVLRHRPVNLRTR